MNGVLKEPKDLKRVFSSFPVARRQEFYSFQLSPPALRRRGGTMGIENLSWKKNSGRHGTRREKERKRERGKEAVLEHKKEELKSIPSSLFAFLFPLPGRVIKKLRSLFLELFMSSNRERIGNTPSERSTAISRLPCPLSIP